MARVVIALTDMSNGKVEINVTADPPIKDRMTPTHAQRNALLCLKGMAADIIEKVDRRIGRGE